VAKERNFYEVQNRMFYTLDKSPCPGRETCVKGFFSNSGIVKAFSIESTNSL
jgi:hypothetical protein